MQSTWLPLTLHLSCSFFFGQGGKERIPVLQEVSLRERIANSRVRVKGKSPRKLKNCGKRATRSLALRVSLSFPLRIALAVALALFLVGFDLLELLVPDLVGVFFLLDSLGKDLKGWLDRL